MKVFHISLAVAVALLAAVCTVSARHQLLDWQYNSVVSAQDTNVIPNHYIVRIASDVSDDRHLELMDIARQLGARIIHSYGLEYMPGSPEVPVLRGFSAEMPLQLLHHLVSTYDDVISWEPVRRFIAETDFDVQPEAPANLDRIDEVDFPLDGNFSYFSEAGTGADVYIVDTGVRHTHNDFGGRATLDFDYYSNPPAGDPHGHGTHVASTAAGTLWGVAKNARVHSVRVLGSSGSGSTSGILAGLDHILRNHNRSKPGVVNFSIGFSGRAISSSQDAMFTDLANAGIFSALAAGNENDDACYYSRALSRNVPVGVVGASYVDQVGGSDRKHGFSNYGPCLTTWAPGGPVRAATRNSDTSVGDKQGTSMASPHVAGVAALFRSTDFELTPTDVWDSIYRAGLGNTIVNAATSPQIMLRSNLTKHDDCVICDQNPCVDLAKCGQYSGFVDASDSEQTVQYFPSENGFTVERSSAEIHAWLVGPPVGTEGVDFELALEREYVSGTSRVWVTSSIARSKSAREHVWVTYTIQTNYRWRVTALNGSGDFILYHEHPDLLGPHQYHHDQSLADDCGTVNCATNPEMCNMVVVNGARTCFTWEGRADSIELSLSRMGIPTMCPGNLLLDIYDCGAGNCSAEYAGRLIASDSNSGSNGCPRIETGYLLARNDRNYAVCVRQGNSNIPVVGAQLHWSHQGVCGTPMPTPSPTPSILPLDVIHVDNSLGSVCDLEDGMTTCESHPSLCNVTVHANKVCWTFRGPVQALEVTTTGQSGCPGDTTLSAYSCGGSPCDVYDLQYAWTESDVGGDGECARLTIPSYMFDFSGYFGVCVGIGPNQPTTPGFRPIITGIDVQWRFLNECTAFPDTCEYHSDVQPGPIAHFRFDERPGSVRAIDSTGNGHDLSVGGGSFTGIYNDTVELQFDGAIASEYMWTLLASGPNPMQSVHADFTISFYFRFPPLENVTQFEYMGVGRPVLLNALSDGSYDDNGYRASLRLGFRVWKRASGRIVLRTHTTVFHYDGEERSMSRRPLDEQELSEWTIFTAVLSSEGSYPVLSTYLNRDNVARRTFYTANETMSLNDTASGILNIGGSSSGGERSQESSEEQGVQSGDDDSQEAESYFVYEDGLPRGFMMDELVFYGQDMRSEFGIIHNPHRHYDCYSKPTRQAFCQYSDRSIKSHWKLDEYTTSSSVFDATGNGRDGVYISGQLYNGNVAPVDTRAWYSLPGGNTTAIQLPSPFHQSSSNDRGLGDVYTLSFWVRLPSTAANDVGAAPGSTKQYTLLSDHVGTQRSLEIRMRATREADGSISHVLFTDVWYQHGPAMTRRQVFRGPVYGNELYNEWSQVIALHYKHGSEHRFQVLFRHQLNGGGPLNGFVSYSRGPFFFLGRRNLTAANDSTQVPSGVGFDEIEVYGSANRRLAQHVQRLQHYDCPSEGRGEPIF